MFWDLLHFYPPFGEGELLWFMLAIALPTYFVGRLLKRKPTIKKILIGVFTISVFVMDIIYHFRIDQYVGAFANMVLIPIAIGLITSWIKFPISK